MTDLSRLFRRRGLSLACLAAVACAPGCAANTTEHDASERAVEPVTVTSGAAWIARHGMNATDYQNDFNTKVAAGYHLTYANGYAVNGQAYYASIWEKSAAPAWVARHGMTAAQYQTELGTQAANGYRLVFVNGYTVAGQDLYIALWDQSTGPAQLARHGMTAAQYQTEFTARASSGWRIKHVSGYGIAGQEYAAIWEQATGPALIARHGMTAAQYQAEFDAQTAAGYHPTVIAAYPAGSTTLFAAVWEQGSTRPWQARHDMSAAAYQQTVDDFRYQGYRPTMISGYAPAGSATYAALWQNDAFSAADLAKIDSVVAGVMGAAQVPGMSIAVAKNGHLAFAKSYGFADKAARTPVTSSSLFRLASISKPITATGIMKLVEKGTIALDQKVFGPNSILGTTYTTKPKDARIYEITVRQILTHTSGLFPNDGNDPMFRNFSMSQSQLITWALENDTLASDPGTHYAYSNFGFLILGRIIALKTAASYETWMKANVLSPAGISDMRIGGDTLAARAPNEVTYYGEPGTDPYGMDVSRMDAHGGWIGSAIDLTRFMVHMDGASPPADLVAPGDLTMMMTPTQISIADGDHYGFGFSIVIGSKTTQWWHSGSMPGTQTIMVRRSDGMVWSAVANSRANNPDIDTMMWNVVDGVSAWPNGDLF